MSLISIAKLKHRNAVRRGRVGVKAPSEVYHFRSIDDACREFFRDRGMPYGMADLNLRKGKQS